MLETSTRLPLVPEIYASPSSSQEAKSRKTLDQSAGTAVGIIGTGSETAPSQQPEALGLHQGNPESHLMDGCQAASQKDQAF